MAYDVSLITGVMKIFETDQKQLQTVSRKPRSKPQGMLTFKAQLELLGLEVNGGYLILNLPFHPLQISVNPTRGANKAMPHTFRSTRRQNTRALKLPLSRKQIRIQLSPAHHTCQGVWKTGERKLKRLNKKEQRGTETIKTSPLEKESPILKCKSGIDNSALAKGKGFESEQNGSTWEKHCFWGRLSYYGEGEIPPEIRQ